MDGVTKTRPTDGHCSVPLFQLWVINKEQMRLHLPIFIRFWVGELNWTVGIWQGAAQGLLQWLQKYPRFECHLSLGLETIGVSQLNINSIQWIYDAFLFIFTKKNMQKQNHVSIKNEILKKNQLEITKILIRINWKNSCSYRSKQQNKTRQNKRNFK